MDQPMQILVNVDSNGEITSAQTGEYIIPTEEWHYHFLRDASIAERIYDHKVTIVNMVPELVLKKGGAVE